MVQLSLIICTKQIKKEFDEYATWLLDYQPIKCRPTDTESESFRTNVEKKEDICELHEDLH